MRNKLHGYGIKEDNPQKKARRNRIKRLFIGTTLGMVGRISTSVLQSFMLHHPSEAPLINTIKAQGSEYSLGLFAYSFIVGLAESITPNFAKKHPYALRLMAGVLPILADAILESGLLLPADPQIKREVLATALGVFTGFIIERF